MSDTSASERPSEANCPGAPAWLARLFAAIDARDAQAFAAFLTEDALFRFGSAPPVRGRDAVREVVGGFFLAIASCRHRLLHCWQDGEALAMQGEVTYGRLDGGTVMLPFVNVLQLRGTGIREYLIYIDNAPLFAPAQLASST
jgi:ketosteroid isomerase-like protein